MSKRKSENDHWSGYNRNYFKRLVKNEQIKYLEEACKSENIIPDPLSLPDVENVSPDDTDISSDLSDTESNLTHTDHLTQVENSSYSSSDDDDDDEMSKPPTKKPSLSDDLASLAVKNRWSDQDVHDLLHTLNKHDVEEGNLPKTKAKLLNTPKEKISATSIAGGSFYYYGIRKALMRRAHLLKDLEHIELDIGIDGARLYHSSPLQIWPKIASIANSRIIRPFLIGKPVL